jgi:CRISPR/Cas system-associated endonuclease Cas1
VFRAPLVDRFSTNLLNLNVLGLEDFAGTPERGILLRHEALKRYFEAYEEELATPLSLGAESLTFRQLYRRQAERLARAFTDNEPYEPFRLPC